MPFDVSVRTLALALSIVGSAAIARAADPLLGSPDFKASPEHPLGWRGDGSGRYPGATPPTDWGRWAKTSIRETRSQGAKPKGDDPASAASLPFGRLENWLILGPIPVEDPAKALEDEILPNESAARPDANDKPFANSGFLPASLAWTAFKAGGDNQHGGAGQSGVEFFRALPHPPGTLAAYAHTYLYAPESLQAALRTAGSNKIWLNGKLICDPKPGGARKPITLDLNKGFNSLLVKQVTTVSDKPDSFHAWRFTATLEPADKSFTYESKNIAWMTPLPAASTSLPVVVGDKILVNSQYADLLCINKSDGKILWLRSNSYYDSLTAEQRAAIPGLTEQVDPMAQKLQALNDEIVAAINANITPAGLPTDQHKALAEKFSAKSKLEIQINDALAKLKVTPRVPHIQHVGTSNGTPVTDGTHVWAIYGGGTYNGPMTVVCYDLSGKRLWIRGYADVNAGEHGNHCSPALADGKIVFQSIRNLSALDAATGKTLWETKPAGQGDNGGGSPTCRLIGDIWVIISPRRDTYRLSDGKLLHTPDAQQNGMNLGTPVFDNGVLYQLVGWADRNYSAFKLPESFSESIKYQQLYRVSAEVGGKYKDATFVNSFVSSPLYDNGLVYYLTEGGVLHVSDAANGTPAYVRMMDEMRARVQWVFWNGACGSPMLGGKHVYITDDNGITVVIEPGREYKKIAVNTLENFTDGFSQEQTLGTPIFEGKSMYYRTPGYLYCIGGK